MLPETPSFRLDNRRALVTGASGGIGAAAAVALAAAGAEVVLAARRVKPMQATVDALAARGLRARAVAMDVTDEAFDALLDLSVRAAFTVAQAVARGMVAAGRGGAIINMGSVNGHVARETISVYTATKHAIEGLTKGMALELGKHGIRVTSLCPTWIDTPLVRPLLDDPATLEMMLSRLPIGRVGHVEDLMGVIVFLASPAAAMITGSPTLVDGGQTSY